MAEDVRSTIQKKDEKGVVRHGGEWLAIWSDPNSVLSDAEKREDANKERDRLERQDWVALTTRSLAGKPIDVGFSGNRRDDPNGVTLPKLSADKSNLIDLRGQGDAKASFLAHSDPALTKAQSPGSPTARRLFLLLEQFRCEALHARAFPGVAHNLVALHIDRMERAQLMHAHLASLLPLAEALRMVFRDTFLGADAPSLQTAGFRMWDRWLRDRFQFHLDRMAEVLEDQSSYANCANAFLVDLLNEIPNAGERQRHSQVRERSDAPDDQEDQARDTDDIQNAPLFEPGDMEDNLGDPEHEAETVERNRQPEYRAFTTQHDQIVFARDLLSSNDLRASRARLDEKMQDYRQEVIRLVSRLQRRILSVQARQWEFDLNDGLIDAAKLDRVVVNPGFEHAYKQEIDSPFRDTALTLLIDNSGSMRGAQIETACIVSELLGSALERCAISTEILGYTTSGWKGGKSFKDWLRAGKPENPGRLNDLLHIVYKDAAVPMRQARNDLCAMLSPSVLKENIDGEALRWAAGRLQRRRESRKILMVLSDGAPVDQATLERNSDKSLLDSHLHTMIQNIIQTSPIELYAIGIKHDVGEYYPVSTQIDKVPELATAVVTLLDNILISRSK